ncbi:MAG: hypothetical protein RI907_1152, partial [Pseudomonadota bacterium]
MSQTPPPQDSRWRDYPRELTMYGSIPQTGRVHVLWSVAVGVFLWLVRWLDGQALGPAGWSLLVTLTHTLSLGYWCWLLVGMCWLTLVRRRWRLVPDARARYDDSGVYGLLSWRLLLSTGLACVLPATALGLFTARAALHPLSASWLADVPPPGWGLCLVLSLSLALGTFTIDWLRVRLMAQQRRADAAQRQALEAQLQRLQAQLEPHMLFNTLANLHALIGAHPGKAQDMLQRLIAFLRSTLQASQRTEHTLRQEFARAEDYLALMAIRMGSRLQADVHLPDELGDVRVPPLIVQPLLENAIHHGLEPSRKGGRLSLSARREGQ